MFANAGTALVGCVLLTIFALLAGLGFRKLTASLLIGLFIAIAGAVLFGFLTWRVALSFERGGGEWRGLGSLIVGAVTALVAAPILFGLSLWQLKRRKFLSLNRAPKSPILLGISGVSGALSFVFAAALVVETTPSLNSTERLVKQAIEQTNYNVEEELIRRGQPAVPEIIAALHQMSDAANPYGIARLLRLLGRLGGPAATTELGRWLQSESSAGVRVAAALALAEQGDRDVAATIAQFLEKRGDAAWRTHHPELIRALGQLKARDQVGAIRSALTRDPNEADWATPDYALLQAAVVALAAMDTDEAWLLIAAMSTDKDKARRPIVFSALEKCPGPRTTAILAKALDDPDPVARETAYVALLRLEPSLARELDWRWSEANAAKLRARLMLDSPGGSEEKSPSP